MKNNFFIRGLIKRLVRDERGEVNMIAIVLIIIVVLILAVIFKDGLKRVMMGMFDTMEEKIENFNNE